jgi:aminopeptidase-like protein
VTSAPGPTNAPAQAAPAAGDALYRMVEDLYPICRSITGDGVRETLRYLQRRIPLTIEEVPTGAPAFDWTIPKEWNIRDAYVMNAAGERVIDFKASNLHVVSYSTPVRARMPLADLRPHLHTLPDRPDWIPYRTSYFRETWGFCLAHARSETLADGTYDICIDASLAPGSLSYGEYYVRGRTDAEVLFSCHVCHPSLCNDNLSGIAVATALAERLSAGSPRYSYRFLFIPGTIGAITWLSRNEAAVPRIAHGLVLSCLGDGGAFTYKRSRRGAAAIDRLVERVLRDSGRPHATLDFSPYGYDERQYCSPGFDLPVGRLTRTPNGGYPEYHTSADDLTLVRPQALAGSLELLLEIVRALETDRVYMNLNPKCEPQLGKRGLYRAMGGGSAGPSELAALWMLNLSDGTHTLADIAERSGLAASELEAAADALVAADLLRSIE